MNNLTCSGESSDAVHVAVRDMRHEQDIGLMCGFTCISSIFIATAIQTWANYEPYIAGTLTVIYGTGLFIFVSTGIHTFRIIGTLDDDVNNLTFRQGYAMLNEDIMDLVDQVRPQYDKGDIIEEHDSIVNKMRKDLSNNLSLGEERYLRPMEVLVNGLPKFHRLFKDKDGKKKPSSTNGYTV